MDTHDKGCVLNMVPILVMDVYEHAYMVDFGIDKKRYINVFFNNINWGIVNKRLEKQPVNMPLKVKENKKRQFRSKLKFW